MEADVRAGDRSDRASDRVANCSGDRSEGAETRTVRAETRGDPSRVTSDAVNVAPARIPATIQCQSIEIPERYRRPRRAQP